MLTVSLGSLLPIAAVIAPATLSVKSAPVSPVPSMSILVPRPDFKSLKYVAAGPYGDGFKDPQLPVNASEWVTGLGYNAPSDMVDRVVSSVASSGELLQITPPFFNSSWELDFHGPALKCDDLSDRAILKHIVRAYGDTGCAFAPNFVAWVPNYETGILPFNNASTEEYRDMNNNNNAVPNSRLPGYLGSSWFRNGSLSRPMALLFFATLPGMLASGGLPGNCADQFVIEENPANSSMQSSAGVWYQPGTVLQCGLFNGS